MRTSNIRLKGKDKLLLFTDLSTMLTAGIPIMETVESLEQDAKGSQKIVLRELHKSLTNGEPLSRGMEHFPKTFDPVVINIMHAAEAGGTLEETLQDIVKTLKKQNAFSDSIRLAMIYPMFIGIIFTGIILLMLTFVIPRIAKVFGAMHVTMPIITRIMIAASNYFMAHWILVSVVFIGAIAVISTIVSINRDVFIRGLLSMPGLQQLGTNIDLMQFTRSFALLAHAGVPLDESVTLSKRVVRKKQIIRVIEHMQHNIESGKSLAYDLRSTKTPLPPLMVRSLETAETSGTLEQTLQNLSEYFDGQVADSLKAASSMIEPVMIVVIGLLVGGLMITIIAPIYNLISQVNGK